LPLRVWHATEHQAGTSGILTCFMTGAPAHEARLFSPEALLEMLLREIGPVIGRWQGSPEHVVTMNWMGDAYAGGGLAFGTRSGTDDPGTACRIIVGSRRAERPGAAVEVASQQMRLLALFFSRHRTLLSGPLMHTTHPTAPSCPTAPSA
jgi:hypothetical protein